MEFPSEVMRVCLLPGEVLVQLAALRRQAPLVFTDIEYWPLDIDEWTGRCSLPASGGKFHFWYLPVTYRYSETSTIPSVLVESRYRRIGLFHYKLSGRSFKKKLQDFDIARRIEVVCLIDLSIDLHRSTLANTSRPRFSYYAEFLSVVIEPHSL